MEEKNRNRCFFEETKNLIAIIYKEDEHGLNTISSAQITWKITKHVISGTVMQKIHMALTEHISGKKIKQIIFRNMQKVEVNDTVNQVIGSYELVFDFIAESARYDILVTYLLEKAVYVQITEMERPAIAEHRIKATNESIYYIEENEILYIESQHNHVIWHCTGREILSNDSLYHLEEMLSEKFVRIQRGYIVNKYHVKYIQRCEAVMRNGDILPIPCKKYIMVRELLMR